MWATRFSTALIVVLDILVEAHLDATNLNADLSPKAGIASLVQLVIGCPLNALPKIAVVRMLQGGCKGYIPPSLRV